MQTRRLGALIAILTTLGAAACEGVGTEPVLPGVTVSVASAGGRWLVTDASARAAGLLALSFDLSENEGRVTGTAAFSGVRLPASGAQHARRVTLTFGAAMGFEGSLEADGSLRGTLTGAPGIGAPMVVLVRAG